MTRGQGDGGGMHHINDSEGTGRRRGSMLTDEQALRLTLDTEVRASTVPG